MDSTGSSSSSSRLIDGGSDSVRLRLLLVDDDPDEHVLVRGVCEQIRGAREFVVDGCDSFDAGLEAVARQEHDAYLVDYRLGGSSGLDLIRAAVDAGCERPMILLTGQADDEVDLAALRAGAADYISKQELTASLLQRSVLYAIERRLSWAARRELDATRRAKDFQQQLLAIVGHDLRNPLMAVSLFLRILDRKPDVPEAIKARGRRAMTSCGRMERIISDLTDYTRIEMGTGLDIRPERTELGAIAEAVVEAVAAAYPERRIACVGDPHLDGEWDAARLAQALDNLLVNAARYGDPDEAIEVTWEARGDAIAIAVSNQGAPIARELLPHVFDAFRRGPDQLPASRGLGLGLFIVHQIATAHGGGIAVASSETSGTTFTLTLPRWRAPEGDRPGA